ncbi:MAG: hypothetical protein ACLFVG_08170 [Candidatus Aminicenantes bacterium]
MKNKTMVSLIFITFFLCYVPLQGQGLVLKKDIVVAEGEVQDNVVSFGGSILIKGKVKESVVAFGGSVIVSGEVEELVLGLGADITLKPSAFIKGDVASIGGTLNKEPGARVDGDTIYFKTSEDIKKFLRDSFGGLFSISLIPLLLIIKLITIFIWLLLAVLVAALFPRQISFASLQIRKSFWPISGIGLLSLVIFVGLVVFSAFLSIILIGIPILLALVFIGIIIKIFSRVVLFYFFGESLTRAFGSTRIHPIMAVILGLIIVSLIGFIPIFGFLFNFCLSIIGWGVVIRTKFGTTENWFRKK